MVDIPIINPEDVYGHENKILHLDDLNKEEIIHILRNINEFRSKKMINEFMKMVVHVKEIMEKFEKMEPIPEYFIQKYDIYELYYYLVDYIFQDYNEAKYFINEPELAKHIIGDISHLYNFEINPSNIKKLNDLTKHDGIRLLRIFNSFRKRQAVDQFLTQTSDIENIYDLFSNFVDYIFKDYDKANYFKNDNI